MNTGAGVDRKSTVVVWHGAGLGLAVGLAHGAVMSKYVAALFSGRKTRLPSRVIVPLMPRLGVPTFWACVTATTSTVCDLGSPETPLMRRMLPSTRSPT